MKIIGAGAIVCAIFLFTYIHIKGKKVEIETLEELSRGIELIKAELGTRLAPMPELLSTAGGRCRGMAGDFFKAVNNSLPLLNDSDFSKLWSAAADAYLNGISRREREQVKKLGAVLGRYELIEQLTAAEGCLEELKTAERLLRNAYPENRKLLLGISAAGSGFLIILLL